MSHGPAIASATYLLSTTSEKEWPREPLPEIAFCGRSNVGKSSLINAMLGRRELARVSKKPGHTRSLNFYRIEIPRRVIRFVDLPGYGFAKVSKSERDIWRKVIETYLGGRDMLAMAVIIVDARHDPTELDHGMLDYCRRQGIPHLVAATKIDQQPKNTRFSDRARIARAVQLDPDDVAPVSAHTGEGIDLLWKRLLLALD